MRATRAPGTTLSMPPRKPLPARRIETSTSFLPSIIWPVMVSSGVSICTGDSGMSRVTSYAINWLSSPNRRRKLLLLASFLRISVSLCWTRGWVMTVRLLISDRPLPDVPEGKSIAPAPRTSRGRLGWIGADKKAKKVNSRRRLNQYRKGHSVAGHSKWANIQHRKGRQDEKRGRIWTRIMREITVAARAGGGDLSANPRLRLALDKARAANMPAERIKYNIDKATGNAEGQSYEEIRYEGYGIGGAAIIVDTMTDNRLRTVAEVRHAFSKHGANMGTEGSVVFQFKHCGQLVYAPGSSEDQVMEVALQAGAEDVIMGEDGAIEVLPLPADFEAVKNALQAAGLRPELAEVTMRAENTIELQGEDAARMQKLLDALEDLDDTQAVYHNATL